MTAAIPVADPRTGRIDLWLHPSDSGTVAAVAADLRAAQVQWSAGGLAARTAALSRWADAIEAARSEIVAALARDTGRWSMSEREVEGAIRNIRRWARLASELLSGDLKGEEKASALIETVRYQIQYVPYGLAGFISPWNFPVTLSLIDAVPALAAGCAVMIKPSEVTPRFVAPLVATLEAVPELKAVIGFVLGGPETGQAVIEQVDLICFTGSVRTGRLVAEAAARRFIPAFLELGGKDPVVVLGSADVEAATDAVLRGSVMNTGQACLSIERIYVQRPLYDRFVDRLVDKALAVALNYPDIHAGHIGPLIFGPQADTIAAHLADAVAKGARIACGGAIADHGGGRWCPATVVVDVSHDMDLMREETFGPVMPVMAFDTADEAVALANDTSFGLSAAVIAGTLEEARAVGERINAGGVSLNDCALTIQTYEPEKTSFGLSGLGGSRMGPGSIHRFLRKKALILQTGRPTTIDSVAETGVPTPAAPAAA
jgi:succinate-semialdehyde dehydrogenase/glutarate-semialdehyde dehydrogenase